MHWKSFWEKWTNWELWPFGLRYLFISPVWLWYCLRSGSLWFFTPSNPTITFGGFEGESKKEMYDQLPPGSYPRTIYIEPQWPFQKVLETIAQAHITYPFVAKPDVGMEGIMVRKIENKEQLQQYHQKIQVTYLIQEFVRYPVEYSVFYYRYPHEQKGVITGFLQKTPLHVTGNGDSTLQQLIVLHPKAKHRLAEMQLRHQSSFNSIIAAGEIYYLSLAANLNRGAHFINLHHEIDKQLHQVFDQLNLHSQTFFYGRYDIKAASLADLKEGKNFFILEYNGSGAEPNHVYNSGYSLRQAHKEILRHWKVLFQIARYNHQQGIHYWPLLKGWRFLREAKKHFKALRKIDT